MVSRARPTVPYHLPVQSLKAGQ